MENVLRNTLVLQENIRSSMTALATKESLKDLATAEDLLDWMGKTQALNQEMYQSMLQILGEMREENRQAGKKCDEFTRTLSDWEQKFRADGEEILVTFRLWTPSTFMEMHLASMDGWSMALLIPPLVLTMSWKQHPSNSADRN